MRTRPTVALLLAVALAAAVSAPAAAYPRPGHTERVSMSSDGAESDGSSWSHLSISADGRYVAFKSTAANLVPGITNDCAVFAMVPSCDDVFVHDRLTGAVQRVSVASDGTEGNNYSFVPRISADGRFVAFDSWASNLVPDDTNGTRDSFVHDRETGVTERVSVATDGTEGNSFSQFPSISADGRYVAFTSNASTLVPDDTNNTQDIFVRDREAGTTERVSVAFDGTESDSASLIPSISADGRFVAFHSFARNLVPGTTNGTWDIYVHDRETGTNERVSVSSDGVEGNALSVAASISADGRHVAFRSNASNLVPGDTNARQDIFVHDRETGTTERVSVASDGTEGDGPSGGAGIPSISADGRYVAFESQAALAPGGGSGAHAYVHDRLTRTTERVSVTVEGTPANGQSAYPSVSADARHVAFGSTSTNLVPGITNGRADTFARDRGRPVGVGAVSAAADGDGVEVSGWTTFSGQVVSAADRPGAVHLAGATLVHRLEEEDLLVRLSVPSLPGANIPDRLCVDGVCNPTGVGAGVPGVVYGVTFTHDGVRYEARALRAAATGGQPYFALYRCDDTCVETARVSGGIGTTGPEVLISVPFSALDLSEGATLSDVRAFTAAGEAHPSALAPLDELDLPDAGVPAAEVRLGIAPAGTPADQVAFDTAADLSDGAFAGVLDAAALLPGEYDLWAEACLGERCGAAATPLTLPERAD